MNHYGARAQTQWKTYQPDRYAQLEDPETFFSQMGEEILDQVQAINDAWISQQRETLNQLDDLARIGRLNALKKSAEEAVFAQMVHPSTSSEETPPATAPAGPTAEAVTPAPMEGESREDWLWRNGVTEEAGGLMPADRSHQLWALWAAATTDPVDPAAEEQWESSYRTWLDSLPKQLFA